jgi:flagellar basal-body rod modification protein FlgD
MEISGLGSSSSNVDLGRITNLDLTAFLNLLTTQMRYQDPMNPQTDAEFLSQMASLSQVQELRDLNSQYAYTSKAESVAQASSLIGKVVQGPSYFSGQTVSGTVSAMQSDGVLTLLVIGNDAIALADVQSAYDPAPTAKLSQPDLARAAGLIGRDVTAVWEGVVVRGTVTAVSADSAHAYLEVTIPPDTDGGAATTATIDIDKLIGTSGAEPAETLAQASWLLGHQVTALDPDSEDAEATISGVATGIRLANGVVLVQVNGKEVALSDLRAVK